MALLLRRKLPLVIGPLILGAGFHVFRQQQISNDAGPGGLSLLNPAQVSARLRQSEESLLVERGDGVLRFDFSQVGSNNPIEDDHSERIVTVPLVTPEDTEYSTDWHFWGIYDGHGGFSTSQKLQSALIPKVIGELNKVYQPVAPKSSRRLPPTDESVINQALKTAFTQLDDEIVNGNIAQLLSNPSRKAAIELLPPALSGSCALLAFFDTATRDLRVAVTGDSRAVLGVRSKTGHWTARALSEDQTGSNEDEVHRIRQEHPQSEHDTCIRRGRVLGIYEPTRSFGDGAVKWTREIQRKLASLFVSPGVPNTLRTPPYMTAEPQITTTKLNLEEEPGFVVLASDGLFEMLSNDQVVGLVVDWMQQQQPASLESIYRGVNATQGSTVRGVDRMGRLASFFFRGKPRRQIGDPVEDVTEHKENLKQPIYQSVYKENSKESDASNVKGTAWSTPAMDANAATHLIRNALGGSDQEQVSLLLSIPSPMSRNYRDDLTVTVVFFGSQAQNSGALRINPEGTIKSKL